MRKREVSVRMIHAARSARSAKIAAMTEHSQRTVEFSAGDGLTCNVINVQGPHAPAKGPVLLVHGAGVRGNIFRAPSGRNLVDVLVDDGWDVWLENWRASIDVPRNPWNLDQAAVYDHPRAVQVVCQQTGASELKAVIHCQGATSFMMSAVAGLVPQVRTIVANAVTLHPVMPPLSNAKLQILTPAVGKLIDHLDPQWGRGSAPWVIPKLVDAWISLTHRECDNQVCKWSSFTYGTGKPTLWLHDNLNQATHEWLKDEFASVPVTFFQQFARCVRAGRLVSLGQHAELPTDFAAQPPLTDARIAFLSGARNQCLKTEGQRRSAAWWDRHVPSRSALHVFDHYGHLDIFMGQRAAQDVFPTIVRELNVG